MTWLPLSGTPIHVPMKETYFIMFIRVACSSSYIRTTQACRVFLVQSDTGALYLFVDLFPRYLIWNKQHSSPSAYIVLVCTMENHDVNTRMFWDNNLRFFQLVCRPLRPLIRAYPYNMHAKPTLVVALSIEMMARCLWMRACMPIVSDFPRLDARRQIVYAWGHENFPLYGKPCQLHRLLSLATA